MAVNPNPTRISAPIWRLWEDFKTHEPTALLGGIYANKPAYHNYRDALPANDYSRRDLAADRRGPGSKSAAIDLTMHTPSRMILYTKRLDAAARARDPRLYTPAGPVIREFIGTKNGMSVYCYVLVGGVPLGVGADAGPDPGRDSSHLWHIHISIIRQFIEDWPALRGVLSVLKGQSLAAWRAETQGVFMAMSDDDQDALKWRVEGLANGRTTVAGGPTAGTAIWPNLKLTALEQKMNAMATAIAGVDEATEARLQAKFAEIDSDLSEINVQVQEVPDETVAAIAAVPPEDAVQTIIAAIGEERARALFQAGVQATQ